MHVKAIIYVITCNPTKKKYIGQTRTHKKTRGKWYKYGILHRFTEHVGSARRNRSTPLAKAIRKYSSEAFDIKKLEICSLKKADVRESYYISKLNTLVPNGYNVQKYSRVRGGEVFTDANVISAEIRGIRSHGKLAKVRVLLQLDGIHEKRRVMFGSHPKTYKRSLKEARKFCASLLDSSQIVEHNSLRHHSSEWWPYKEKIDMFNNIKVNRIRIVPFGSKGLVSVYVKTDDMKSWKEEKRITFGGKFIDIENAYKTAYCVALQIGSRHKVEIQINEKLSKYQGQQQVAASRDE